mgnify:CR=1 FL=1
MYKLQFSSDLAAPAAKVWARVSTMDGVNAELHPLMHMTAPAAFMAAKLEDAPLNQTLFRSWLLLFCVLPVDRHALMFERFHAGTGFDERSTSWSQKLWMHRRRVLGTADGCRVTDELEFVPRLGLLGPLLKILVARIFMHRHHRLRALFGAPAA